MLLVLLSVVLVARRALGNDEFESILTLIGILIRLSLRVCFERKTNS